MKQRLTAYTTALNRYDLSAVEGMFAEDAVYISPGLHGALRGRAAIMAAFRIYFADHADQVNVDKNLTTINATDVQSDWSLTATNTRTGETVSRKGTQVMTFNNEGQIARIQVLDF